MNIDTMKFDSGCCSAGTNSRHGTTPMIDRLIADVDQRDRDGADEDRARDDAAGILDLVADVADVVVAEVVVDADARRGAEAERKPSEKLNAPGGKSNATRRSKCSAPVTMTANVVDQRADPEGDRDLSRST